MLVIGGAPGANKIKNGLNGEREANRVGIIEDKKKVREREMLRNSGDYLRTCGGDSCYLRLSDSFYRVKLKRLNITGRDRKSVV